MRETTYKYICDLCGCEIKEVNQWVLDGNTVTIREGIIARPIVMDICKTCFENMKTFCKTHKKEKEDA